MIKTPKDVAEEAVEDFWQEVFFSFGFDVSSSYGRELFTENCLR